MKPHEVLLHPLRCIKISINTKNFKSISYKPFQEPVEQILIQILSNLSH
jgi:hypothetical protein